jgi:hypothetical protein
MDGKAILKRFDKAKPLKTNWASAYDEAMDFAMPNRCRYTDETRVSQSPRSVEVVDSIGATAMDAFVSNTQAALFPPTKGWMNLKVSKSVAVNQVDKIKRMLNDIVEVVFDGVRRSNFDTQIALSLHDYSIGMGSIMVFKGTVANPFRFISVPSSEVWIEEGPWGRVAGQFREWKITARNLQPTWDDIKLSETLRKKIEDTPDKKITLVEATIPEEIEVLKKGKSSSEKVNGFVYYVIEKSTGDTVVRREYEKNPWIIFRWPGPPGQLYPEGPMLKALADIKSTNEAKKMVLKRASRDLFGIYTYLDDSVLNLENLQFGASCFIPVDSNGGARGESIKPLPSAGDMGPLTQFVFSDLEAKINKQMYAEPFGRVDLPVKTATEIQLRQQELFAKRGASYGRVQYELMAPLMDLLLYYANELGLIDADGLEIDGQIVSLEYESPLAQIQDREEAERCVNLVQTLATLYGPQVAMSLVPPDRVAKYLAEKMHVPPSVMASDEEIETMKQAIVQQSAQASSEGVPPEEMVGELMEGMAA